MDTGEPIRYEEEYFRPAIGRRYLYTTLIPVRHDIGPIRRLIVVNQDITERKQAEDDLQRSEEENQAIRLVEKYAGDIHLLITDVVMPEMNGRELAGGSLPSDQG